jgi:hypothetical protein
MTNKHKITPRDLDEKGGIERLEAMGHDRHTIHNALFNITDGISNSDRTNLVKNLYTRSLESRYGKPTRWI